MKNNKLLNIAWPHTSKIKHILRCVLNSYFSIFVLYSEQYILLIGVPQMCMTVDQQI